MSSEALVHIGQQALAQGGQGIDFSDPLFNLKPATLAINQRMTQAEGAIPGKFRIVETGDQFDEMSVALLAMPTKERQCYIGEPGQLNRTQDNLICFSRNCCTPDPKAKIPQAIQCGRVNPATGKWMDTCPKASWEAWRKYKEETGTSDPKLIPPCDPFYRVVLIDTNYKLPVRMYVRGGENKAGFEQGMQELARKFKLLQSQGRNPNIFDLRFTMKIKTGKKKTNYVLAIDGKSIRLITDEERADFGEVYLQFINRGKHSMEELEQAEAQDQIEEATAAIDAEVVQPGTESANVVTGEIVI